MRFLLLRPVADLNEWDQVYRAALLGICPVVQTAQRLVAEFQRVVKTHDIGALAAWLTAAQTSDVPELQGFALGIRQDRAAVEAGITEPWSQRPDGRTGQSLESNQADHVRTGQLRSPPPARAAPHLTTLTRAPKVPENPLSP